MLGELLDGDVEHLLNLGDLQAAVDELGDEALNLYAARARDPRSNDEERNAVATLIGHLDGRRVSDGARLSVALDQSLPLAVRLAAFALGPAPIDARALPLIEAAIAIGGFQPRSSAMVAIAKTANPPGALRAFLLRTDMPLEHRLEIVNYVPASLSEALRSSTVRALARDPALADEIQRRLLVYAARYGDETAMTDLIGRFNELPVEIVGATLSLFGHHRTDALAKLAVDHLRGRSFEPRDRVSLTSSAVVGMTSLFEMDSFLSGGLRPAPPHPGLDAFRALLEEWGVMEDYTPLDALQMDQKLADAGVDAATRRLPDRIARVLPANDVGPDQLDPGDAIAHGIRTLQERRVLLSISFLESVVARCSHNAASSAVQMIAAHGTREALDSLLAVHTEVQDWVLKGVVLDALESLAGRLSLRVRVVDGGFEASTR